MKRVEGSSGISLLECVNPVKNKWRVRWDVQQSEEEDSASYMEEEFPYKPTTEEIKTMVIDWYNQQIGSEIISGFTYNGVPVWLSQENQFNYKAAYDLAVQTDGTTLPVTLISGHVGYGNYSNFTRSFKQLVGCTPMEYRKAAANQKMQ